MTDSNYKASGPDGTTINIVDVSKDDLDAFGRDIDFDALDVMRTAPAMLTGAERLMLFNLIYCLRPQEYIEVGIRFGGASLIVSKAMDASSSDGKLYLVDASPEVADDTWKQIEHRSELIEGWSPGVLTDAAKTARAPFDFAFIDAGHQMEAVLRDSVGVFPFLADGAYLLFHDAYRTDVREGIDRFVTMHPASLVDVGMVTRQFTRGPDENPENPDERSCGFRLVQYRKQHGLRRPFVWVKGLYHRILFGLGRVMDFFRRAGRKLTGNGR